MREIKELKVGIENKKGAFHSLKQFFKLFLPH